MRELKFRAWVNEHWVDWLPNYGALGEYNEVGICADGYNTESECFIEQYTGLKDKNGKEIYEGDIVSLEYYEKPFGKKRWRKAYLRKDINIVGFEDGYFKFSALDKDGYGSELFFSDYGEWSGRDTDYKYVGEIIGNIHENPELFGEEE